MYHILHASLQGPHSCKVLMFTFLFPVRLTVCPQKRWTQYNNTSCRTVGLSDTVFDSLTLFDTVQRSSLRETVSDGCRTAVGLSDCRTVGHCRTVGNMSELCRKVMSDCRTGAQSATGRLSAPAEGLETGHVDSRRTSSLGIGDPREASRTGWAARSRAAAGPRRGARTGGSSDCGARA